MSLFDISFQAIANPAADNVTTGQMFSGLMVLMVVVASLAMIVVWVVRLGQTGHALPAARRGVLRIPLPLTAVAVSLSILLLLLTLLVSIENQIIPPPAAATASTSVPESANEGDLDLEKAAATLDEGADSSNLPTQDKVADADGAAGGRASGDASSVDNEEAGASTSTQSMTPGQMKTTLIQTVVMDLILFFLLGAVVMLSSRAGRVPLPENNVAAVTTVSRNSVSPSFVPANSLWPDLDDASAIPQLPGYTVLGERTVALLPPEPAASENPYDVLLRDASISPLASVSQEPTEEPWEPFSFLTEMRYAGEVFLAAYVPTAFLKILVVLLTVGLLGEVPGRHPFLEMMDSEIGTTVLSLIVLVAVLFAPVVEELQFRVIVLGGIAQIGRPLLALSVSSLLFAIAHGFPDSLALLPLAFALGYAYLRRRSYITVMLVHFLFNGFNMVLALLALL